ncbi:MAG: hypothetical protein NTW46_04030 [Candidatus Nealsonbacteria bacterium]|nr:hypothetical protein [Candidatus Nealsonbacteria bacterium]
MSYSVKREAIKAKIAVCLSVFQVITVIYLLLFTAHTILFPIIALVIISTVIEMFFIDRSALAYDYPGITHGFASIICAISIIAGNLVIYFK